MASSNSSADIRKNITGLRTRLNKHNDPTLEAILDSPDKHAIASVVLLVRGYRYVCRALLLMQQQPELDLYTCFKRTYDEVLAKHHSAVIRGLVSVALRAAPSRPDFYARLSQGGDIEEFDRELAKWLAGLDRIVTHIDPLLHYYNASPALMAEFQIYVFLAISSPNLPTLPPMSLSPSPNPKDPPPPEYESGRVICHHCGDAVPIRDDSNDFTTDHWDAHRQNCPAQAQQQQQVVYTPESTAEALAHPPAKRRRAKRTEEERIQYLRSDPYVAQFEAYRVLCASCHKWIRLRPNSTYCSIPWDAHRKSCLAKKVNSKNVYALEERNNLFGKDPDVRKFDAERVLCNLCDKWIDVPSSDHLQAVQKWLQHRADCQKPKPKAESQQHHNHHNHHHQQPQRRPPSPRQYSPEPQQAHESRRRNAEQRAATLRADKFIGEVEPNRVFCLLCQKWVQLRQDSSYCAYPWIQHKTKCEKRHQRHDSNSLLSKRPLSDSSDSDDADSEDDRIRRKHHQHPKDVERYIAWLRSADRERDRDRPASISAPGPSRHRRRSWDEDADAEGELDADADVELEHTPNPPAPPTIIRRPHPVGLADLDSPAGRRAFISESLHYLFATTYESSDDMSVSALLTYLNAAMPQDKHEDFDTTEVVRAVTALQERGRVILQVQYIHAQPRSNFSFAGCFPDACCQPVTLSVPLQDYSRPSPSLRRRIWLCVPKAFRRRIYSFLLFFGTTSSNAPDLIKLPFGLYAKHGGQGVIQEALTLQFIEDYTTIPAPTVLDTFDDPTSGPLLVMSRAPGTPLSRTALDSLPADQITLIADTLRDWLNQLQYFHSPYGRSVCGYLGGALTSYRISAKHFVGPYRSQDRFHEEPCCALTEEHDVHVRALAAIIRQKRYDMCLAHGNVAPENVLVDKRGQPVGLVGWECAVWVPSYWELTAGAWAVRNRSVAEVWTRILVRCLPQYTDELKVERELWKTYTPF
ncbi:hypothetical protein P691DRAFT_785489 [Macrolepiota fuliginosa MF-IS2]|uniref:Aminoglycoside phosphotransferase domain-containing protein n=1 Tax=Macrolepiota fuliginosa MF-IS2 TaxID=1400762 RepID=A0A9P5X8E8_9AGAR|nr:hypothetical protein P691DRAFT_785489 [Macrolepiota fuliginosa MF-IS2]